MVGHEHDALGLALAGQLHHVGVGGAGLGDAAHVGEPGPSRDPGAGDGIVTLHRPSNVDDPAQLDLIAHQAAGLQDSSQRIVAAHELTRPVRW